MPITKRVIDKRSKEKFMIDDAYLNGQAKLCGWQATLVYNSLCRHANKGQESFPSIKLISEELNISRPTVLKGLENLEKYNVIIVEKQQHGKAGKWLNNSYILLDKSEWIKVGGEKRNQRGKKLNRTKSGKFDNRVNDTDTDTVSVRIQDRVNDTDTDRVNDTDTKETHKQGNTYKEVTPPPPKISKILVDTLLKEMNLIRPDGDYLMDNLLPAKEIAKYITEIILKEKKESNDEEIVKKFILLLQGMDNFHKKNATSLKYIKYNFNKILNTSKVENQLFNERIL